MQKIKNWKLLVSVIVIRDIMKDCVVSRDKENAILYFEITRKLPSDMRKRIIIKRNVHGRIIATKVPQVEYPRL